MPGSHRGRYQTDRHPGEASQYTAMRSLITPGQARPQAQRFTRQITPDWQGSCKIQHESSLMLGIAFRAHGERYLPMEENIRSFAASLISSRPACTYPLAKNRLSAAQPHADPTTL